MVSAAALLGTIEHHLDLFKGEHGSSIIKFVSDAVDHAVLPVVIAPLDCLDVKLEQGVDTMKVDAGELGDFVQHNLQSREILRGLRISLEHYIDCFNKIVRILTNGR